MDNTIRRTTTCCNACRNDQYTAHLPSTFEAMLWNDEVRTAAEIIFAKNDVKVLMMSSETILIVAEKLESGDRDWKKYVKYEQMDGDLEACEYDIISEILNNKMVRFYAQELYETGKYEIPGMCMDGFYDALIDEEIVEKE